MRVPRRSHRGAIGFNMTPMIDVVFQLIIFFLLSSHLAKSETQLVLPLPQAESGSERAETRALRLTLNVTKDGGLILNGHDLNVAQLEQRLRERMEKDGAELELLIRADRGVPYHRVEPVLRACARAGIWNVSFAVHRVGEGGE